MHMQFVERTGEELYTARMVGATGAHAAILTAPRLYILKASVIRLADPDECELDRIDKLFHRVAQADDAIASASVADAGGPTD
jgi:hypothetical protein